MNKATSILIGLTLTVLMVNLVPLAAQDGEKKNDRENNQEKNKEEQENKQEEGEIFSKTIARDKLDDVVILLDTSGSMYYWDKKNDDSDKKDSIELPNGKTVQKTDLKEHPRSRIARAKWELMKLILDIPEGNDFNLVFFNTEVDIAVEGKMIKATDKARLKTIEKVAGMKAEGGTRTDKALKNAFQIDETKNIYLISDGAPMGRNGYLRTKRILKRVKNWNNDRGARIYTLGFDGTPVVPKRMDDRRLRNALKRELPKIKRKMDQFTNFMKTLATENNGDYTSIK